MDSEHTRADSPTPAAGPGPRAGTSSTIHLPPPPEGEPVLMLTEAAERLGVNICALRIWVNGRGMPYRLCADDRTAMVRPTRYRAPGPYVRNPKICFLRSEIEALAAQIESSYRPSPHPDTANFPGCHRVPVSTQGTRDRANGPRGRYVLIDSADAPLIDGLRLNVSAQFHSAHGRGVVILAANHRVSLKQLILGLKTIDRGGGGGETEAPALCDQRFEPLDPGIRIVHLNGDDLDCRRANLAVRTALQVSVGNSKITRRSGRPTTSAFKGVCWVDKSECWGAFIARHKRSYYLGMFDEEEDAAREYDNAARWLFGEPYAKLNFPLERPALRRPTRGLLSRPGAIEKIAAEQSAQVA